MVGIKRRRKVEGWALDVSETDAQVGRTTLGQRLAESNKLWAVCVLALFGLTAGLIWKADRGQLPEDKYLVQPAGPRAGASDDMAHREFARKFASERSRKFTVVEARFVGPDNFRITVPGNTSKDDIDFLAKVAGMKIVQKFGFRPVVQVYIQSPDAPPLLVATAQWETKKYGFVVRFPKRLSEKSR